MYRQGSRREPRLPEQFSMRSPDAHSRSDLTWGGTRALGPFPVTTRDVTVVSSRPHPPSPATRDAHSEDADREARKRERERARTAQCLRPAQVLGTSAVGRAEWQYGRTARCTPGPPGVHALGQVDFGALFEESWRQTSAFFHWRQRRWWACQWETRPPDH